MKMTNTISTALTAGLIALMGLPSLAVAGHGVRASSSGASCALPSDYPAAHVQTRRRPPVKRRLEGRIKRTRKDVRSAIAAMDGLNHWRAQRQIDEARRRVTEARYHVENGAFRAADRTLQRVDELVRLVRTKARELDRVRSATRSNMREYRRNLAAVERRVDEANCTLAAGHLRKAGGAFGRAKREAGQLDWDTARTFARKANAHRRDALNQAIATLDKNRRRGRFDNALSTLDSDLRKARKAGSRRSTSAAARALLMDARRLKARATSAGRNGEFERGIKLARRGSRSARGALEMAVHDGRRGRGHRHARAGRHYRTEMPFASANARRTSSQVW